MHDAVSRLVSQTTPHHYACSMKILLAIVMLQFPNESVQQTRTSMHGFMINLLDAKVTFLLGFLW